jgi:hypothetical protein
LRAVLKATNIGTYLSYLRNLATISALDFDIEEISSRQLRIDKVSSNELLPVAGHELNVMNMLTCCSSKDKGSRFEVGGKKDKGIVEGWKNGMTR